MTKFNCPECSGEIEVPDDAMQGEIVSCPDCGEEFEVNVNEKKDKELKKMVAEREDWGE
ncbi:MAG: alpha-aminoadipate/glutamate carrier protein LysW/ArgW [Candidatus Bathyarchaeota archaeon]|nr:alpha-aminoadipate/glutamate carrier protein LysW/ArgW [Candidatus Bathyarchaeota archaeon]